MDPWPSIPVDTARYPDPSQFAAGPLSQAKVWKLIPSSRRFAEPRSTQVSWMCSIWAGLVLSLGTTTQPQPARAPNGENALSRTVPYTRRDASRTAPVPSTTNRMIPNTAPRDADQQGTDDLCTCLALLALVRFTHSPALPCIQWQTATSHPSSQTNRIAKPRKYTRTEFGGAGVSRTRGRIVCG